jgi:CubicO group peptidase (beta-lactamase class C family)
MALDIVAWHDRTAADHQSQYNNARIAGYSTVSLCIYGDPGDPRFAAAMVRRPAQAAEQPFFSMNGAGLQTEFNNMAAAGWGPLIITGTGSTNNPRFAAIFTPVREIPFTRFGITAGDLVSLNASSMSSNLILRWADAYGDPGNLRYIAIWVRNPDNRAWNNDSVDDNYAITQQRFDALVTGGARPVVIASTPDVAELVAYDDSQMPFWQQWVGMTSADYQAKFNALYPQGLRPIRVSAKGTGSNARFSVIFSQQEDADARNFRTSGPGAAVPAIDAAMEAVMTANMIRGASVAVVAGTRLVYVRGYTFAEPVYPDVQPTTFFRQASVSKMFTAAALYQLMDDGAMLPGTNTLLTLDTLLKDALPNIANGTPDPNWNSVTVRHLLEMTSGITFSLLATDPNVSSTLPITALQMAEFLYRQTLSNTPGDPTQANYSNAGFMLLGLIVARMRGATDLLTGLATFLNRLSITRVRSSVSVATAQPGDEARYHPRPLLTWPSVMVTGQPQCTMGYGDYNIENLGGGGGLSAAATDVARVAAALSATFKNPMMSNVMIQTWLQNAQHATATLSGPFPWGFHGFDSVHVDARTKRFFGEKGGSLSTSQNGVHFEIGGISTVICWNGATPAGPVWFDKDGMYQDLITAARTQNWGTTDLFPMFGMPAFPVMRPIPIPIHNPIPLVSRPIPSHMLPQSGPRKQA